MKTFSFEFQRRIRYYEVDQMGYCHNSNVFRLFENGREEAMRSIGLSYNDIEKNNIMMPLIEQYCKYFTPAKYDDLVTVVTTIKQIPAAKIRFDYSIFTILNDKRVLNYQGYNVLCFVDKATRLPQRVPQWIKEKFENLLSE